MGADWNNPTVSRIYNTQWLPDLLARDVDAVTLAEAPTNPPSDYIRWNRAAAKLQTWNGAAWVDLVLSIAGGGTGGASASAARTALGLGTMATQNSNAVAITGGTIAGVTVDASVITSGILALARGGLGASLSLGALGTALLSDGSGVVFSSGVNIANLDASHLTQGTLPSARFSGIYSNNLTLSGSITFTGLVTHSNQEVFNNIITFNSTVAINAALGITGNLTIVGAIGHTGNLTVTGNVGATGTLGVLGNTALGGGLDLSAPLNMLGFTYSNAGPGGAGIFAFDGEISLLLDGVAVKIPYRT